MLMNGQLVILRQICNPVVFNPCITTVRFAKRRIRQSKKYFEFTNMADWRRQRGLPVNPNYFSPLTNLPDYSYLDGRPVPVGINMKTRLEKQKEYADAIIRLSGEVDYAKERYKKQQEEKQIEKQKILDNKLIRKGTALIDRKS